jgi:hypothetical protein
MELTFAPKGILQIDDAKIVYKNFRGEGGKYNREGDRNFLLVIPNREIADRLIEDGWNVKAKPSVNEGEDEFITLRVKVKFNNRGPQVFLISGGKHQRLSEETVEMLDDIDISSVDLDIRPYDWTIQKGTPNEKSGRTAYLQSIKVTQNIDRFTAQFAEEESPEE